MKNGKKAIVHINAIPQEIQTIAKAIAEGNVRNVKMEISADSFSMIADSADGKSRLILGKESFGGVFSENKIDIPKPNDIEERLIRVKKMTEDGKTQKEIAKFTMTSQKTVSNDIKKLKERGSL